MRGRRKSMLSNGIVKFIKCYFKEFFKIFFRYLLFSVQSCWHNGLKLKSNFNDKELVINQLLIIYFLGDIVLVFLIQIL